MCSAYLDWNFGNRKVTLATIIYLYAHLLLTCTCFRICNNDTLHCQAMSVAFSSEIAQSNTLRDINRLLFVSREVVDPDKCAQTIIEKKKIAKDRHMVKLNIRHCLQGINYVNAVIAKLTMLKSTAFNEADHAHVELLESIWTNMKPSIRRRPLDASSSLISAFWGDVGFQG